MKKYISKIKGFSLIELLVVIAIIAILTAVITSSIYSSKGKARDAKRISDIAQIQLALEQYFDKKRTYPANLSTLVTDGYISVIPKDPTSGVIYPYYPIGNLDYFLKATLEKYNDALKDALSFGVGGNASYPAVSCLNDTTNREYCIGPK